MVSFGALAIKLIWLQKLSRSLTTVRAIFNTKLKLLKKLAYYSMKANILKQGWP